MGGFTPGIILQDKREIQQLEIIELRWSSQGSFG